eukprot:snap_masked-scaffold_8-processed-gene-12.42-mRNA-1 protein AED:1.00 eAED:1.00 QI:0/-1/0/0/-1/1/1/0/235
MRRGVGIQRKHLKSKTSSAFQKKSNDINTSTKQQLDNEIEKLKDGLKTFLQDKKQHKVLQKNPEFRSKFHLLCNKLGIDALTKKKNKYAWADLFNLNNKFYAQLSVRLLRFCFETKKYNGGILSVDDAVRQLAVNEEDIFAALESLEDLGKGITYDKENRIIISVGKELNSDSLCLINYVKKEGLIALSVDDIQRRLLWKKERIKLVVGDLLSSGVLWVDKTEKGENYYFCFSFF